MNKIEVIQFFIADSAVLFFHVRIISRTPWTNFRYKGYFCRLIGQRQRITYLFAFTPGLCIIQVNGGSYSIKKNVFLIDVIDNIDFGIRIQRLGHQHPGCIHFHTRCIKIQLVFIRSVFGIRAARLLLSLEKLRAKLNK